MKIVVLGGGRLAHYLASGKFQSFARVKVVPRDRVDVEDVKQVTSFLAERRPDVVVLTAAVTNRDTCEVHPKKAFAVNSVGAGNVALVCAMFGIHLMYLSTDEVFDGKSGPYTVDDVPYPVNAFGVSKLYGERLVRSLHPNGSMIVRLGWLHDGLTWPLGGVSKAGASPLPVASNVYGSPMHAVSVAVRIHDLALSVGWRDGWLAPIVHLDNGYPPVSWMDFMATHYSYVNVKPQPYRGIADVPRYAGLSGAPLSTEVQVKLQMFPVYPG